MSEVYGQGCGSEEVLGSQRAAWAYLWTRRYAVVVVIVGGVVGVGCGVSRGDSGGGFPSWG